MSQPTPSDTVKVQCDRCHEVLFLAEHVETEWTEDGEPIHAYVYSRRDFERATSEHDCTRTRVAVLPPGNAAPTVAELAAALDEQDPR